jgi:Zn-finger nucleic acid-binding protein
MKDIRYNGWTISKDIKPIPIRNNDFDAIHDDYDYDSQNMYFTDKSLQACILEIDSYYFSKKALLSKEWEYNSTHGRNNFSHNVRENNMATFKQAQRAYDNRDDYQELTKEEYAEEKGMTMEELEELINNASEF